MPSSRASLESALPKAPTHNNAADPHSVRGRNTNRTCKPLCASIVCVLELGMACCTPSTRRPSYQQSFFFFLALFSRSLSPPQLGLPGLIRNKQNNARPRCSPKGLSDNNTCTCCTSRYHDPWSPTCMSPGSRKQPEFEMMAPGESLVASRPRCRRRLLAGRSQRQLLAAKRRPAASIKDRWAASFSLCGRNRRRAYSLFLQKGCSLLLRLALHGSTVRSASAEHPAAAADLAQEKRLVVRAIRLRRRALPG